MGDIVKLRDILYKVLGALLEMIITIITTITIICIEVSIRDSNRLYMGKPIQIVLVEEGFPEEVIFEISFERHVKGDLVNPQQQGQGNSFQSEDAVSAKAV